MYQALYRKYRPNNFDEVTGQDVIIKTLKNEILNNKLNHAYLFAGPRGTGKTSVAKILAKTINCTELNDLLPCNKCVSCTQIDKRQTTDIIEIDAASNNGVDEIRELKSKVNLVPATSKYKIYIIDEVHMMTIGAFNALLKTLEEPPAHVIFILATTDPQKIPVTILSRCQRFDFKKIGDQKIVNNLKKIANGEKFIVEDRVLMEIARLSDGSMRDSISVLDQSSAYADERITLNDVHEVNGTLTQNELKEFIDAILKNELKFLFQNLEKYNSNGKNFSKLTDEIIMFLRNILLYKTVPNYFGEISDDTDLYKELSDNVSASKLLNLIQTFNSSLIDMKNSNNPKIIMELVLIQLSNEELPIKQVVSVIDTETPNDVKIPTNIKEKTINEIPENKKNDSKLLTQKTEPQTPDLDDFNRIKELRINNALADFNKKKMCETKLALDEIRTMILNPKYSKVATLILDGELKACGNNQLIYVFNDKFSAETFNDNLLLIEDAIGKICDNKFKVIAVNADEWITIKKEFNSKTKQYKYIEEAVNIQIFAKKQAESNKIKNDDEIANMFGNIVNYK